MQHNLTFLSVFQFTNGWGFWKKLRRKNLLSKNQIYKATFSRACVSLTREKLMDDHLKFSLSIDIIIITHREQIYDLPATRIRKFSCSSWEIWCFIVPRMIPLSGVEGRDSFSVAFKWRRSSLAPEKRLRSSSRFRAFSALASKIIVEAYKKTW